MSELKATLTPSNTLIGTLFLGADYYKGETGDSGVYLGESAPTDEKKTIWIEPAGDANLLVSREELEEAINNIEIPMPDLSDYAKADEIPDVSNFASKNEIPDVSGFQTAEQVETAISNALSAIGVAEEGAY